MCGEGGLNSKGYAMGKDGKGQGCPSGKKRFGTPTEPSWGRSLLHGQDMCRTQEHQSSIEQFWRLVAVGGWRLAVGDGWRLAVGGWWWVAVGGGWRLAVGGWWSLELSLTKKKSS